jgi:magnesium transporter
MANLNPVFRKSLTDEKVTLFQHGKARTLPDHRASAEALMKTKVPALRPDLAVAEAIKALHRLADQNGGKIGPISYVYVTDEEGHLLGVFSLNDLISAHPGSLVQEFMKTRVISVKSNVDVQTVARTVAEYNLRAIPVVDDQNRLQGIITADDAQDTTLPRSRRKRLLRFSR